MSDFLPEPHLLLLYCLSIVVLNLTPGPDMTFFLSRSIAAGKAAGMAAMLGATTGILIHTLLVVFGLSALIAASPSLYNLLRSQARYTFSIWPGSRSATVRPSR